MNFISIIKNVFVAFFKAFFPIIKIVGIPVLLFLIVLLFCIIFQFYQFFKYHRDEVTNTSINTVSRDPWYIKIFLQFPKQLVRDFLTRSPDAFREQGLIIFTGRQGRGKTISMVEQILLNQKQYPKSKCLTNFNLKSEDVPLEHWSQLCDFNNGEKGVIVGIDELQNWFSCVDSKDFPPEMLAVITQNRKNRRVIYGTAQSFHLVAKSIRSQCTEVRECHTYFNCLTVVKRKLPVLESDGNVKEMKKLKTYWFVHTPEI